MEEAKQGEEWHLGRTWELRRRVKLRQGGRSRARRRMRRKLRGMEERWASGKGWGVAHDIELDGGLAAAQSARSCRISQDPVGNGAQAADLEAAGAWSTTAGGRGMADADERRER
ncbi:hypothetical protein TRIUR3_19443 [Triticum urartu]|uniref:Uncharacterized protein n=1 Tax=Triticum urartu TaxID=4572 RepID=M7ZCT4_TRIUA|nr:hypothetical protein TRIUR3_19443 [Triticum urartu]